MKSDIEDTACGKAIVEIAEGNKAALSVIYDQMARLIFSVSYAITGNYADAEDVLQETMIEIVRYSAAYKIGSNAQAWILTMARHIAVDIVRKKKTAVSIEDTKMEKLSAGTSAAYRMEVFDMLSILDKEEKQLIIYRLYAGFSYFEIAHIMDITVYAAQKRYQRTIKKLKKFYS